MVTLWLAFATMLFLLEPLILLFMAAVVVVILLAIYLPIIQMISAGPFGGRH